MISTLAHNSALSRCIVSDFDVLCENAMMVSLPAFALPSTVWKKYWLLVHDWV
jgi:hypothetical protein